MTSSDQEKIQALGLAVIKTEAAAVAALEKRINGDFVDACNFMLHCKGRIVVMGMGKSGHIANKIAATLASTGSPAFFVHPGEASHGDLGMITQGDVVLVLSNSGEIDEIVTLIPIIRRLNIPLISMTGNSKSTIAREADVNLDVGVDKEACPLGLAPTSSTTAALVMGDALAISLLEARGFTAEDFARSHPGGTLGRRLLLHVSDIMHRDERIPRVHESAKLAEALVEMSAKGLGMTAIVDSENKLIGIFTDGDLRRTLDAEVNFQTAVVKDVMSRNCTTIRENKLAAEALQLMESKKISALIVVDEQAKPTGALNMHDLLTAGVM
jgi:arabinose-5-phosphate isomerase